MTHARSSVVDLSATPYYHCIGRCVRRAFLCGEDAVSGQSFEHRKAWVIERLTQLSDIFTIDVCAYAVMSNHYHLVLQVDSQGMESLSDAEVSRRWRMLFGGLHPVTSNSQLQTPEQHNQNDEKISLWRERLTDISWYMRCLNEWIARRANKEDNCKGRFWEGRFKSQALLDEQALVTCMAYVDLNPIRANMAQTPETSDYTSIQQRIAARQAELSSSNNAVNKANAKVGKRKTKTPAESKQQVPLLPFADEAVCGEGAKNTQNKVHTKEAQAENANTAHASHAQEYAVYIPLERDDYLTLVDWTGREIRADKKNGIIPDHIKPILDRLQVNESEWVKTVQHFGRKFYGMAGTATKIREAASRVGCAWFKGVRCAQAAFKTAKVV